MRRKLLSVALAGLFLVALIVGTAGAAFAANPSRVLAAPAPATITTTSGSETIHFSAADCAKVQAAAHTTDASVCTATHTWTATTTVYSSVWNSALNTSCPSGTRDYHDNAYESIGPSIADFGLDSYMSWNGNCQQPTNYKTPDCHANWSVNTTWGDSRCYNYVFIGGNPQRKSTANVYSQFFTFWPPVNVASWFSQRRESYNLYVDDTEWQMWVGL